MRRLSLSLIAELLFAPPVLAHPLTGTKNRDRIIVVRVTATALIVDYRLELDEGSITTGPELPKSEWARVTSKTELFEIFTRFMEDILARNLDGWLDGQELHFKGVKHKFAATDHLRCDYRFEAAWSLTPNK